MKKLFSKKFIKYLVVGVSTVLLDFLSLIAIKEWLHLSATIALIINQSLVWIYNFNINKHWTFANKQVPYKQFFRYLILAGTNYLVSISAMYFFSERLGFNYLIIRLITIGVFTLVNYLIYKHWVYA